MEKLTRKNLPAPVGGDADIALLSIAQSLANQADSSDRPSGHLSLGTVERDDCNAPLVSGGDLLHARDICIVLV